MATNKTEKTEQTMIANLEKKTGKTLQHWIDVLINSKLTKSTELAKYLKTNHGFTQSMANFVAVQAKGIDPVTSDAELLEKQFEGKEEIKPFYEKLIKTLKHFGPDVEITPKDAYISIRRKKQFAMIQASTKARLDIGLNLKGQQPRNKLEPSGSFSSTCSHRIRVEKLEDVDQETIQWLMKAYENAK
jgi:predicted transport protein